MAEKKEKPKESEEAADKKKEEESDTRQDANTSAFIVGIAVVAIVILIYAYGTITGGSLFDGVKSSKNEIKIGFMGPLTGDAASYGHAIKRGVELALKDSGLENVKLIYEDTKCDGKEAVSAVRKLIDVDGVVAIVGEVCSGATLATAPIAEQNKVVMISASSTSPEITKAGEYIFRTIPSDSFQGKFGAALVFSEGFRNLSILFSNEEYGIGFKNVLKENFEILGGKVVAEETFERGVVDLRTQLAKIRAAKPDAIYIISNSPDSSVAILKQLKQMGIKTRVFGSEGLKGPEIAAQKAAQGLTITSVSAGTESFADAYMREHGLEVQPFAPQAYDAFDALARAIKNSAKTGPEIQKQLTTLQFEGASGSIDFDEQGDVSGTYDVYQLQNNTFVLVE